MNKKDEQCLNEAFKNDLISFLKHCCTAIKHNTNEQNLLHGTDEFIKRLDRSTLKDFPATQQPVSAELKTLIQTPYLSNFKDIYQQMKWRPSPRADYNAEVMALCTLNEMLDLGDMVAGLMFMTPEQVYPEHNHPPQELYFVLSGNGSWMFGGNTQYTDQKPGDIIYNNPHDLHGIKTQKEPLLALYFLWGNSTQGYSY